MNNALRGQLVAASWLQPKPGRRDELIALLKELGEKVHAEPGCVHYSVHRPSTDDADGALLLLQAYASREAFEAHAASIRAEIPRVAVLLASPAVPPPLYESLWLHDFAAKEVFGG